MQGKKLEKKDIENVKLMIDAGFSTEKICELAQTSRTTVSRVRSGHYDEKGEESFSDDFSEAIGQMEECLNKNSAYIGEAVYLVADRMKAIQSQLDDIASYVKYLAKQESIRQEKEQSQASSKPVVTGKWSEILNRVKKYGDQLTYTYLKGTTARWDGETLMIDCKQPDRDYLSRNKDAVDKIKAQAQLVLGVPVTVKW